MHTHARKPNGATVKARTREEDIGTTALYRDYYMTGWGLKEVTEDDVRWTTLVASRTQNKFMICRLLPLIRKASSIIQLSSVKRYLFI